MSDKRDSLVTHAGFVGNCCHRSWHTAVVIIRAIAASSPGSNAAVPDQHRALRRSSPGRQLDMDRSRCRHFSGAPATTVVSHAADTLNRGKPVDAASGSDSSPRSKARRHLKTWFAFTPCDLATSATLAPGSNVSATIRRFSATDRHLRARCSAPDPSD
jgi:hypothetical protein